MFRRAGGLAGNHLSHSSFSEDASNDPTPHDPCTTGDIRGVCHCEFGGPAIAVTIEGTTTL
jgi:hypothetical protein